MAEDSRMTTEGWLVQNVSALSLRRPGLAQGSSESPSANQEEDKGITTR